MKALMVILSIAVAGAIAFGLLFRGHDVDTNRTIRVAMTGRSTMELWFKHWNWPLPLRYRFTYRHWPIPYERRRAGDLLLEYRKLAPPGAADSPDWGAPMTAAFDRVLATERFDAAFFKFCFVDFPIAPNQREGRLLAMQRTVRAVHETCRRRGVRLILGNAIPVADPSKDTLELERDFNGWLDGFARENDDVVVFDMFGHLADAQGNLPIGLRRGADDAHPNDGAFGILDEEFFSKIPAWLERTRRAL